MKKLIFAAAIALMSVSGISAQRIVNNPDNHSYWGVRAGLDVSGTTKFSISENNFSVKEGIFDPGCGFNVGVIYNMPIVANLYFEPGLTFYYNTFKLKTDGYDDENGGVKIDIKHASVRQSGMRIPLNFGYHFDFTKDFNVAVITGPQLEVGFSCDNYITVSASAGGLEAEEHDAYSLYNKDSSLPLNRFNLYWNAGLQFNYRQFSLGVLGQFGLTNTVRHPDKDDEGSMHINRCSINLGYNF